MSDDVERLVRDIFPAEVLLADGTMLTKCRVFLTTKRLQVWQERSGEPFVAAELTVAEPEAIVASGATMMKDDRIEVRALNGHAYVNKGPWCGCGTALRMLAPPCRERIAT